MSSTNLHTDRFYGFITRFVESRTKSTGYKQGSDVFMLDTNFHLSRLAVPFCEPVGKKLLLCNGSCKNHTTVALATLSYYWYALEHLNPAGLNLRRGHWGLLKTAKA